MDLFLGFIIGVVTIYLYEKVKEQREKMKAPKRGRPVKVKTEDDRS